MDQPELKKSGSTHSYTHETKTTFRLDHEQSTFHNYEFPIVDVPVIAKNNKNDVIQTQKTLDAGYQSNYHLLYWGQWLADPKMVSIIFYIGHHFERLTTR